jgi:ribosome-associated protein
MAKTERKRPTTAKKPLDAARDRPLDAARDKRLTGDIAKAVRAALDKKALDVVVLDLRGTPAFTDFFLLCSGQNTRQVHAIADAVEDALREVKVRPNHVEGYNRAEWVLMDFFTFVVHVFTPQTRDFYSLERLWGDAERIDVSDEAPVTKSR